MRVFQDRYRGADGVKRAVKCWSIELVDHLGTTRQIATGQRDKKTAEAIGRNIERLVRCRVSGEPLDPATAKWLEGVSPKVRGGLARIGLLDAARMAAMRPLVEHVLGTADMPGWKQYIASKGNTQTHIEQHPKAVLRAFNGTGMVFWSDISATRLMTWLNELRIGRPDAKTKRERRGLSAVTFNGFVTALKSFGKWMQREGRVSDTPLESLRKVNAKTDKRHVRRPLEIDELRWLLDHTRRSPKRARMTGPERAMLYRLAVETGLRSRELASLTRSSFRLDAAVPTVTVQASHSKHRREDVLPLRPDTAADLREFFANKPPLAKAFDMPSKGDATRAIFRPDLRDARQAWIDAADATTPGGPSEPDERSERTTPTAPSEREQREASSFLCYLDPQGRYADFHALRHTTGTLLAAGGVTPKTTQTLMRHSDINLTMILYTHTLAGQEAAAIATLPNFTTDPTKQQPQQHNNTTATPPNAPAPPANATDATTAASDTPATTDTPVAAPAATGADAPAKTDDQNPPKNSTPVSSPTVPELGICTDTAELPTVLAEATKKDENIVKVDYFPVKSPQQGSTVEPQVLESEIRSTKSETNPKAENSKLRTATPYALTRGGGVRVWNFPLWGLFRISCFEFRIFRPSGFS